MAHQAWQREEDMSSMREELVNAQKRIVTLQQENERLRQRSRGGDRDELQRERLALFHRHMYQEVPFFDDMEDEPKSATQPQIMEEPNLPDGQHEEFQNLESFLLDGGEGYMDSVNDEGITGANSSPEVYQEAENAEKDINNDTPDDPVCVFCETNLPAGTASSHYMSCYVKYHRWSGTDSNNSFFYHSPLDIQDRFENNFSSSHESAST